jgi:uncharacterized membrane protein
LPVVSQETFTKNLLLKFREYNELLEESNMNRYALILPLLILAVLLGYFSSSLPREWIYAVVIVVGVVASAGYLLYIEQEKGG